MMKGLMEHCASHKTILGHLREKVLKADDLEGGLG